MSLHTRERDLEDIMSKYGRVTACNIIIDQKTQRSRGFGFVTFAHTDDAKRARDECNGKTIDDREVRVDYSITRKAHTPTPGQYMGRETRRRSRSRDRRRSRP